jgi:hypothetical protein
MLSVMNKYDSLRDKTQSNPKIYAVIEKHPNCNIISMPRYALLPKIANAPIKINMTHIG